ncbi:UNVERIFIED_CONTAM: sorting nexin 25 [Gekko kuhli]
MSAELCFQEMLALLLRRDAKVFDYTYRDYILSWYGHLSRDEGQLYHLLSEDFWEVAKQLRHRLSNIDVVKVVCHDVVKALLTHFCDLKVANSRNLWQLEDAPRVSFGTRSRLEELPRPFFLHPCLKDTNEEVRFLKACSQILVCCLLPSKDAQSLSLRIVLAEILASKVLKPVVELLSDPDYINQMLLAQMEYREQVNEHHKRAYTYAPSYEEFIKLINSNSDVEFLKQLSSSQAWPTNSFLASKLGTGNHMPAPIMPEALLDGFTKDNLAFQLMVSDEGGTYC